MTITPLQYAKALFEATQQAPESSVHAIVARFADRLRRDGQTQQLSRIVELFTGLWNASNGIVTAEVVSQRPLGSEDSALIEQSIAQRYRAKKVIITNRVDSAIGGGVIVRVGDDLLDGSVATQLARLRKQLRSH